MRTPSIILFLLLYSTSVCQCTAGDLLVTISEKTTHITGPLKADGYPDYLAALNARFRTESSPQNNLALGIWETVGPTEIPVELRPLLFEALGVDGIPVEGDYLVGLGTYQKQQLGEFDASKTTGDEYAAKSRQYEDAYSFVVGNNWTKQSHPLVFQWWEQNHSHIEALVQITATHDQYYHPYVLPPGSGDGDKEPGSPVLISILLPGCLQAREAARTLSIDAHYHLGQGDIDAAIRSAIATHRIGRLTARGGTVIEGLVGIAIGSIASSIDRHILTADGLNAKQLENHLAQLRSLPSMPSMIDKVNLAERYMFLDATIHIAKNGASSLGFPTGKTEKSITGNLRDAISSSIVDWDYVLRKGNYWYDEIYRVGTIENIPERAQEHAELVKRFEAIRKQSSDPISLAKEILLSGKSLPEITSEQVTNILISLMMPAFSRISDAENRYLMGNEISQLGIALELHYLRNNSYPSNLKALIGPNLKDVPTDRFNEGGLIYKSTGRGYLLYSFGLDGQDDQGQTREDDPAADDLALKRQH